MTVARYETVSGVPVTYDGVVSVSMLDNGKCSISRLVNNEMVTQIFTVGHHIIVTL